MTTMTETTTANQVKIFDSIEECQETARILNALGFQGLMGCPALFYGRPDGFYIYLSTDRIDLVLMEDGVMRERPEVRGSFVKDARLPA